MPRLGGAYSLPLGSESGADESEENEPPPSPPWRRWLGRGASVLVLAAMLLYFAAWGTVARRRMTLQQKQTKHLGPNEISRLWGWQSVFSHIGIPWVDGADVAKKAAEGGSGHGSSTGGSKEHPDKRLFLRHAASTGTTTLPATVPLSSTSTTTPVGPPPLDPCQNISISMENGVPTCDDQRSCLCIIDIFMQQQPRGPLGLLQTRAGSLGGGPCGENCTLPSVHRRCDTYDNAVAVIYYTKRGFFAEAKKILDILQHLLYPAEPSEVDPSVVYHAPSGRKLTLLATAYSTGAAKAEAGHYSGLGIAEGTVDTGNNAWAALAFAHYAAATNSSCYATVARDILHALKVGGTCGDKSLGFIGRMPPKRQNYRSAEHNIDVLALARMLGEEDAMEQAQHFVRQMYQPSGHFPNSYRMGEVSCGPPPPVNPDLPVPADVIYWGVLAEADPDKAHASKALAFALGDTSARPQGPTPGVVTTNSSIEELGSCCGQSSQLACCPDACCIPGKHRLPCCGKPAASSLWEVNEDLVWEGPVRPRLNGTRFTSSGNGVQWEVSAGAAMALVYYNQEHGQSDLRSSRLKEVRSSLKHLLAMYKGVPATILGGNFEAYAINDHNARYPGGTDTGISFTYLRYKHVASTAWTGLLLLYQPDEDAPLYEDANPFKPPGKPMPSGMDNTCQPWLKQTTAEAGESVM